MRYHTVLSLVGLFAVQALATSTTTKTQSYSYPAPDPKDTQYIGLIRPTTASADGYRTYSCEDSKYTTSGKYFKCEDEKTASDFITSCGGAKPSVFYTSGAVACPAKATCVTDIVYADKKDKNPITGYHCTTKSRAPTFTLYRSNPPEIINGKPSGASGLGGEYVTVGALFAGFFTLGMAIML